MSSTTRSSWRPTRSRSRAATSGSQSDPFERGVELIRAGSYFEAHEELEVAWRAAEPAERDFLQGLVHVAVAWYQAGRGNRYGCTRQLEKAERRLAPYAPAHRGTDLRALLGRIRDARATVTSGSLELPKPFSQPHPPSAPAPRL